MWVQKMAAVRHRILLSYLLKNFQDEGKDRWYRVVVRRMDTYLSCTTYYLHTQRSTNHADDDEDEESCKRVEPKRNVDERVIKKMEDGDRCFPAHSAIFRATTFL